jgi:3-isopropylmalate/(R)-2-methylmalate dehydratase small subunit
MNMPGFKVHKGKAVTLAKDHVDTDQIIPKQFLKKIDRSGYGEFLFFDWRYLSNGESDPSFELNKAHTENASILISGKNFGCGSSREHAPWALKDYGFDVIIAESFADIFFNNCVKNGILPIRLQKEEIKRLNTGNSNDPVFVLTICLENQQIKNEDGNVIRFDFDPYWKEMLLNGWDEISLTLQYERQISDYENKKEVI